MTENLGYNEETERVIKSMPKWEPADRKDKLYM
jgi:hypothetical protein